VTVQPDLPDLDASLVTTGEAAELAMVDAARGRDWKRRGLLTAAATDRRGWPLFRPRDVLAAERLTRRSTRGRPRS